MPVLRRLALWLAIAAGAVLLVLGAAVMLVDSSALTRWAQEKLVPRLEERIGRDVSLQSVDVDLIPHAGIVLQGFRVAGGGPQPLVAAQRAVVHLALWPLLRSRGQDIRITGVELVRPEVTLLRASNGTWDWRQPLDRLRGEPTQAPSSSTTSWSVDRITIKDGIVRLVDATAQDGGAYLELSHLDATLTGLGPGRALDLRAEAALRSDRPNLHMTAQLSALPVAGGPPPRASGRLDVKAVPLALLRPWLPAGATSVITGGNLELSASLTTRGDGAYAVEGSVASPDLRLRDQPASARAKLVATVPADAPDRFAAELREVAVKGPGIDLSGGATVGGPTPTIRFDVRGPLLDLDTLLGLVPASPQKTASTGPLLSPQARKRVQQMDVTGNLAVDRVVSHHLTATQLHAQARLQGGKLLLGEGTAGFYGGTADLSGTSVDLSAQDPVWSLRARLHDAQLGTAMQSIAGAAPVSGKLGGEVNLQGVGIEWAKVARQLNGLAGLQLEGGTWTSVALSSQLAGALRDGIEKLGAGGLVKALPVEKGTTLRRVAGQFRVRDGWMALTNPLELATPFGNGTLTGRVGLDHRLDLRGSIELSADYVSQLTGRALQRPVKVPLVLGGTLEAPQVSGVDAGALAQELLPRREIERNVQQGKKSLRNEARRKLEGVLQGGG